MSRLVIQNGRVVDPSQGIDRIANVVMDEGRIVGVDVSVPEGATIIDATDRIVTPGLIDMNVQLREPGFEEDETIATGTAAAIAGGFTTIACLPNTDPPVDTPASVAFIQLQAERSSNCNVVVIACVSKQRDGEQLAEMGSLTKSGAVAFSDATAPVHNAELMRRALQYSLMFDRPILNHPEVRELSRNGVMHEGQISTILGLKSMPVEAEDVMVSRDVLLAEATGGRLHCMNISTSGAVELIRRGKSRGVLVTCEVTAAHLCGTDSLLREFSSACKLNPPFRSQDHVEACIEGLRDGTIDVIVSGHAPRAAEKKMLELDLAPFGMSGLESVVGLVTTFLINPGHLDWTMAVEKLSCNPARILRLDGKGTLAAGADADVTIIDPSFEWSIDPTQFHSKSRSTPFAAWRLYGAALSTIVGGEVK